jgi:hypothetical protein
LFCLRNKHVLSRINLGGFARTYQCPCINNDKEETVHLQHSYIRISLEQSNINVAKVRLESLDYGVSLVDQLMKWSLLNNFCDKILQIQQQPNEKLHLVSSISTYIRERKERLEQQKAAHSYVAAAAIMVRSMDQYALHLVQSHRHIEAVPRPEWMTLQRTLCNESISVHLRVSMAKRSFSPRCKCVWWSASHGFSIVILILMKMKLGTLAPTSV